MYFLAMVLLTMVLPNVVDSNVTEEIRRRVTITILI